VVLAEVRGQAVEQLVVVARWFGSSRSPLPRLTSALGSSGAAGHDAARAVILEGPAHEALAIGQQRRGQRIAPEPGEALAVEGEFHARSRSIRRPPLGQTGAHVGLQSGRLAGSPRRSRRAVRWSGRNRCRRPPAWRCRARRGTTCRSHGVAPALEMHALGVGAQEEVGLEIVVRGAGAEALEMRLAAGGARSRRRCRNRGR
jgi:hypothetical protein